MGKSRTQDGFPSGLARGIVGPVEDELQRRLSQAPGAWKLLSTSAELLLALKDRPDGLLAELNQLLPAGAVLAGDLSDMQPSDLLNFLHQGRRTGVLLARGEGTERGLALVDGNVAWACSTSPGERLGEILCRIGLADRPRVDAALFEQVRTSHRRIGQLLVDKGVIGPDELWRGLKQQTVEIFLGFLVSRTGSFVFLRGLDRAKLPAALNLDTQGLLLDGLRRMDEMELYRTVVPHSEVRPRWTRKKHPAATDGEVSTEAREMLARADGSKTLAELAAAGAIGEFEATKAAYKLISLGLLELQK